jgi:cell division protein ZapA
MPLVNVMVNNKAYTIACDDGEEEHLKDLASHVDSKVKELLTSVGQVGDQRLILMAALLISDELHEATHRLDVREKEIVELRSAQRESASGMEQSTSIAAEMLENAASRMEDIAARLAHA